MAAILEVTQFYSIFRGQILLDYHSVIHYVQYERRLSVSVFGCQVVYRPPFLALLNFLPSSWKPSLIMGKAPARITGVLVCYSSGIWEVS